jgi:hypothetical protein
MFIMNVHHAALNKNLRADLVQMPTTDNIGCDATNKVDITKSAGFSILAGEEYCAAAYNLHDGAITESHSATHTGVKVIECLVRFSHVVR